MASKQLCSFYLAGHLYGIELDALQEVTRHIPMTPVPASKPWIGGLLSLRGHIMVAVDLRERLYLPKREQSERPMNVVVLHERELVSLLVDTISDIIFVEDEEFSPLPPTVKESVQEYIVGAFKLEKELLVEIDIHGLLHVSM